MSGTPIIRSGDLRAENRYRLLETLRRHGPLSRPALGERTRLSAAALSTLIAPLVAEGALEISSARGRRGRPQTSVALAPAAASVITVSLSIDRLRTAVVDYGGSALIVDERALDTRALDETALLDCVGQAVSALAALAPGERVERLGVAFQGVTENGSGALLWSPIIGARAVPLRAALEERFGIPASVGNDCALIARALHQRHLDTLGPDFATVLFTHGVGLALTRGGRPVSGIRSSALEMGHLRFERDGALCRCGRRGCIEAYAADYGIERMARGGPPHDSPLGRLDPDALDRLIEAAHAGEARAVRAFAVAGAAVGEGLAGLFTLFDAMPVALVGRSDKAFALMAEGLRGALEEAGRGNGAPPLALHRFDEDESLLGGGLSLDTLDALDRHIATRGAGSVGTSGGAPGGGRNAGDGDRGTSGSGRRAAARA